MKIALRARPRVAPLGHPHTIKWSQIVTPNPHFPRHRFAAVMYEWAWVKPDGSGWTLAYDDSLLFEDKKLDDVLEAFYEWAGPYPYDFTVVAVEIAPEKPARRAKARARGLKKPMSDWPKPRKAARASRRSPRAPRRSRGR